MSAGPGQIDPVRFCESQVDRLAERIDHIERALVDQVLPALIQAREQRVADVEQGVEQVLERLTNDSKFGGLHYSAAADHLGRRWYDRWRTWLGGWAQKVMGGMILAAAVGAYWFFGGRGPKA